MISAMEQVPGGLAPGGAVHDEIPAQAGGCLRGSGAPWDADPERTRDASAENACLQNQFHMTYIVLCY